MKRLFKYLKKLFAIYGVSGSIWLLYRIEDDELKTYGYYTDYDRAVLWSESGKYSIVECKTWG